MRADAIDSACAGPWIKAKISEGQGQCAEAKDLPGSRVAVRQSTDPTGPALIFTRDEFAAFLTGAKAGEFDHLGAIV
ncbi:DUF397 domain-containing protein [Kitasatospora sp. NA04385]|nr:DUF397 domain-containing protein [Kitasatospora sp. NA04385]